MSNRKKSAFDNKEMYKKIGLTISYYRKRKGLTQEELAELAGISKQHLGAVEAPNMDTRISLEALLNIATVLEIKPYKLLSLEENPK